MEYKIQVKKLKICVVGSSGYIGSYLSSTLKKEYKVFTHSRKKINDKLFYNKIFGIITGDIKLNSTIKKILECKPDVIIYTISYNHFKSEENIIASIKNNYEPFQNLIKAIVENNIKTKIIYFSTMQVYGREYKKKIVTEKYPKNLENIYALTHSMCEDLMQAYKVSLNYYVLRLSNSFGMPKISGLNCWWPVLNNLCKSAKENKKIIINSDGSPLRDFISLDDISNFIKIIINNNITERIINLCSSKTLSIKELAMLIQKNRYFEKKIPIIIKKKSTNLKKKKFKYSNKIMIKNGFKKINTLNKQIETFLSEI